MNSFPCRLSHCFLVSDKMVNDIGSVCTAEDHIEFFFSTETGSQNVYYLDDTWLTPLQYRWNTLWNLIQLSRFSLPNSHIHSTLHWHSLWVTFVDLAYVFLETGYHRNHMVLLRFYKNVLVIWKQRWHSQVQDPFSQTLVNPALHLGVLC